MRVQEFVDRCRTVAADPDAVTGVRELVEWVVRTEDDVVAEMGSARRSAVDAVYVGDDLTILHVVMPPAAVAGPHDHRMWAVVGVHGGRETNDVYARAGDRPGVVQTARIDVAAGTTLELAADAIHSVSNLAASYTAAIHVYGGNLFGTPRSAWGPSGVEVALDDAQQQAAVAAFQRREAELGRPLELDEAQELLSRLRGDAR